MANVVAGIVEIMVLMVVWLFGGVILCFIGDGIINMFNIGIDESQFNTMVYASWLLIFPISLILLSMSMDKDSERLKI